jgi:hypothetical protein
MAWFCSSRRQSYPNISESLAITSRPASMVVLTLVVAALSSAAASSAEHSTSRPNLSYFQTNNIPLSGWDAPAISNNWLWAQAAGDGSILAMEDIQPGAAKAVQGSTDVLVNGQLLQPDKRIADWLPNSVTRRATVDGVTFTGTVRAARQRYALLNRLEVHNPTSKPVSLNLEIRLQPNGGLADCVDSKPGEKQSITLQPGATRVFRSVNSYRTDADNLRQLAGNFDTEWAASDDYWNELLDDAYTPGPGPLLSGGVPAFLTSEVDAQRLYNFGVVTALLLMKNDPDNRSGANLYVTAMPDAEYGTFIYIWDFSYASEILAMLDPLALRKTLELWTSVDVDAQLAIAYEDADKAFLPGRFYASNGSSLIFAAWNYINYTGDYEFLNHKQGEHTVLERLRQAADWHKTRPAHRGLAHYGTEDNLFDDMTVDNYEHYVVAPNAGDVWANRAVAEIYDELYNDSATATELRAEADRIAAAVNRELYNNSPDHAGTWKQLHVDGSFAEIRHSWDFMMAATFMTPDLSPQQKQAMRDWFVGNLMRADSEDVWVVAQDPRDGNNGEHQMEHNGRGAYPAWPYHDGWALHAMGFQKDVVALLRMIDGVTPLGAIGQGYSPDGRRCRSNWANISGASMAAYPLHNVFDVWPGLGEFEPHPDLAGFDANASFENVLIRGKFYRVTSDGAIENGNSAAQSE